IGGRNVSVCRLCMVVAIFVPSFLFFHLIPDAKTASRAVFRPRASTSTTNRKGEIRQGSVDSPRICDCRQTSSRSLTPFAKGATGLGMTPAEIFLWGRSEERSVGKEGYVGECDDVLLSRHTRGSL